MLDDPRLTDLEVEDLVNDWGRRKGLLGTARNGTGAGNKTRGGNRKTKGYPMALGSMEGVDRGKKNNPPSKVDSNVNGGTKRSLEV